MLLNSINLLVLVVEMPNIFYKAGNEFLNII
jgi:hypothetical protein